jgi:CheY-like chemotaxis protein/anti-sigma regulatory factor (Ser/Thr protein kinase)
VPEAIDTDAVRLRQIVLNLLGNAIKYTRQGEVVVSLGMVEAGEREGRLLLRVRDTGPGMTDSELSQVFQPFFRAEGAVADGAAGTGLGLAISRRLAELLGGRLEAESAVGRGSVFTLTLPVADARQEGATPVASGAGSQAEATVKVPDRLGGRVLVAEDNAPNRRVIAAHLKKAGVDVVVASNGEAAVEQVFEASREGRPFDVILMDMHMPVLDGYEATRRLRAGGVRTPIVALTAHAMPHDREKSLDLGCNDHISKPFDWEILARMIAKHTARGPGD